MIFSYNYNPDFWIKIADMPARVWLSSDETGEPIVVYYFTNDATPKIQYTTAEENFIKVESERMRKNVWAFFDKYFR